MQSNNHSQDLLKKFILNQCTKAEVEEVITYIQEITGSNQLPAVKDVLALLEEKPMLSEADANRIHDNIINSFHKKQTTSLKKNSHAWKYAIAASIILLISISFLFNKSNEEQLIEPIIVNTIETGTDKATLTLGDGSQIALEKGSTFQTNNANSNGEKIIYEERKQKRTEIIYNYLTIPRGGQFQIALSDGTQVWLNSESQLKFPVSFIEGETRKVELLYGEAYFDVSPSIEHKGSKFKVINQSQEIEVLGTEFNIRAYKDESNIYTTLVEGKVSVSSSSTNQVLKPTQQANLNLNNNMMTVATVDVYNEVSWKEGVFSFNRKPLVEIMAVLSRWYNLDVEFVNQKTKNEGFNGALSKDQNIEDILKTIKNFGIIKDYEIKNKTVILK